MKLITLYFSGTGNSEYIAKAFSKKMNCTAYSIEKDHDFTSLISSADTLCFVYPIHHSLPPMIVKDFIKSFYPQFKDKKLISLCTQQCFSGDGAMSLKRYLPSCTFIYAQHFNMPNNIGCIPLWSNLTRRSPEKCIAINNRKLNRLVDDLKNKKVNLHGNSKLASLLGKSQNSFEKKAAQLRGDIKVSTECILCNQCVKQCPTKTLINENHSIQNNGQCTFCFRCVNLCPKKAITVSLHRKPSFQYDIRDKVDQFLD